MLVYNPLEQFTVNSLFGAYYYSSKNWLFDLSITNYTLTVVLLIFFIISLINVFGVNYQINSFFQNFIISLLNMSYQFIKDQIGTIANTLFPLMTTYLFISLNISEVVINKQKFFTLCVIPVVLVITILIGLEFAVACIQAYVFMTLSAMYFHDAFLLH